MPAYRRCDVSTVTPAQQEAWRQRTIARAFADLGDVVYFLRRGNLIKIGHSRQLKKRIWCLAARPEDLLCLLPGGRDTERNVHERFAHLRATGRNLGREHFHPEPDLLAFINAHRERMGLDSLAA